VTGATVDSIVLAYAESRTGQRGIAAYSWLVSVLRTKKGVRKLAYGLRQIETRMR